MKCEKVLKAVFRKFRKSAVLSYLQADLSASCIHLFKEKLYEEIQKNDAVFISGDIPREDKIVILQKLLDEYAKNPNAYPGGYAEVDGFRYALEETDGTKDMMTTGVHWD